MTTDWVIVPRKLPEAMKAAGVECPRMQEVGQVLIFAAQHGVQIKDEEPWPLEAAWNAMLDARPNVDIPNLADGLEILRTDIRLADAFVAAHTGRHEALVSDRRKRAAGFRAVLAAMGAAE